MVHSPGSPVESPQTDYNNLHQVLLQPFEQITMVRQSLINRSQNVPKYSSLKSGRGFHFKGFCHFFGFANVPLSNKQNLFKKYYNPTSKCL